MGVDAGVPRPGGGVTPRGLAVEGAGEGMEADVGAEEEEEEEEASVLGAFFLRGGRGAEGMAEAGEEVAAEAFGLAMGGCWAGCWAGCFCFCFWACAGASPSDGW